MCGKAIVSTSHWTVEIIRIIQQFYINLRPSQPSTSGSALLPSLFPHPGRRSRFCRFFLRKKGITNSSIPFWGAGQVVGSRVLCCASVCTFAVKFNVRSWKTIFLYAWVDQLEPHSHTCARVGWMVVCKAIHPSEIVRIPVREGYAKHFWDPGWDFPVGLGGLISGIRCHSDSVPLSELG